MTKVREAAGGGRVIEVEPRRLTGWMTRFAARHGGVATLDGSLSGVRAVAVDGATAELAAPFPPMDPSGGEPVEVILGHCAAIGQIGIILARAGAFSIGIARGGRVLASSTDTRYVQSRTAAGGWSQQRYQRRRANQRRDSARAAADTAVRVLGPAAGTLEALTIGGDTATLAAVLDDRRLAALADLPRRTFTDIAEPRRAVLDAIAARALTVEVTVREPGVPAGTPR